MPPISPMSLGDNPAMQRTLALLGRPGLAPLIRCMQDSGWCADQGHTSPRSGASPIMAAQLRELEDTGFVLLDPATYAYSLTDKGRALARVIALITDWSVAWPLPQDGVVNPTIH